MEEKKRCVAYCRVSTKNQEESLANQRSYFERELSNNEEYELVDIYYDEGITGTSLSRREALNQMLRDAGVDFKVISEHQGENRNYYKEYAYYAKPDVVPRFDRIYVKSSSRLARTTDINKVIDILAKKGVDIYFCDMAKSTSDSDYDTMFKIKNIFDSKESEAISQRIKFGNAESAKQKKIRSAKLFGYTYNRKENTLRIREDEAAIVREMFQLRAEGKGGRIIANIFKEKGYKTRAGKDFTEFVLTRMLQNHTYRGCLVRNIWEEDYKNNTRRKRPESEWIIEKFENIDPIVDDELFFKVNELISSNTNNGAKKGKNTGRSLFNNKVFCGFCGNKYTVNVDKGVKFYNCKKKKVYGTKACGNKNIRERDLLALIKPYLDGVSFKKRELDVFNAIYSNIELAIDNIKATMNSDGDREQLNAYESDLKILDDKLDKLIDMLLEAKINNDEFMIKAFDSKKEKLEKEITGLESKIDGLKNKNNKIETMIGELEKNYSKINELLNSIPDVITEKEFIDKYLHKIIITGDSIKLITVFDYCNSMFRFSDSDVPMYIF